MSKNKNEYQWAQLYQQYEASGLSITAFCKQQHISTSFFYLHRDNQPPSNNFIQAKVTNEHSQSIRLHTSVSPSISLDTAAGSLSLPLEIQASFLIKLIKGLA